MALTLRFLGGRGARHPCKRPSQAGMLRMPRQSCAPRGKPSTPLIFPSSTVCAAFAIVQIVLLPPSPSLCKTGRIFVPADPQTRTFGTILQILFHDLNYLLRIISGILFSHYLRNCNTLSYFRLTVVLRRHSLLFFTLVLTLFHKVHLPDRIVLADGSIAGYLQAVAKGTWHRALARFPSLVHSGARGPV